MQTFLTRYGLASSAKDLDNARLGKQRVEAKQILDFCIGDSEAWGNHPASKMWVGYEMYLCNYGAVMCAEWQKRGFSDTLLPYFARIQDELRNDNWKYVRPPWATKKQFILSHRSNLVRKDANYYQPKFPNAPINLPYVWPITYGNDSTRYFLSKAEARRVDPRDIPEDWSVNWDTREVTFP